MRLSKDLVSTYVGQMPAHVREYLVAERGLTLPIIWIHQLGWNGSRITLPIFDHRKQLSFFRLARGPQASPSEPKMACWPAGQCGPELYGWEHLRPPPLSQLVICEGEFDRLVLESRGIPAVTGTAGATVFRESWAAALAKIPRLYVCFDRDDAGRAGARRVAGLLPEARVIELPESVGAGGDVSDFFVRLKRSVGEFRMLMADAKPLAEAQRLDPPKGRPRPPAGSGDPRAMAIKTAVPIAVIVRQYIPDLRPSGPRLVGKCIFHSDDTPSLVVYPDEGRFYCYGCATHGDVIQFIMEAECCSFSQALRELEKYLRSIEP